MASHAMPMRWQDSYETMNSGSVKASPGLPLQQWPEEMYFDGKHKEILCREDIVQFGEILDDCCDLSRFAGLQRAIS